VNDLIRIGMDTSKSVFVLHGVDATERPMLRKKLRRRQVVEFFEKLPPTRVGIEACGAAHHWARELGALGHEVVLLPPQLVKPYVARNKNDAADAEAICEAMSRPRMRFVPVKTAEQQAALMLAGIRGQLVARRTQLSNAIRGYAAEFGLVAARGLDKVEPLLVRIAMDATLPALAKELFATLGEEYAQLRPRLGKIDAQLLAWHRQNELSQRLAEIPSVGPIGAALMVMKVTDPQAFRKRPRFCRLARADPEGSLHRRQAAARGDHARRRRNVASRAGGWRDRRHPAGTARPRASLALAGSAAQAQTAQAGGRGTGQQDGAHRLEADGQRRTLPRCARRAWCRLLRGRFVPTSRGSRRARRRQGAAWKRCGTPHRERDGRP